MVILPMSSTLLCLCVVWSLNLVAAVTDSELSSVVHELEQDVRYIRSQYDRSRAITRAPVDRTERYSNEWVAHIQGGLDVAKRVAGMAEMELVRVVRGLTDTYVLRDAESDGEKRKRGSTNEDKKQLNALDGVEWAERQRVRRRVKRDVVNSDVDRLFNDPLWPKQWHLHDTRDQPGLPKLDLHVVGAWQQGFNGSGVVVCVLDDGLQHNHSDLIRNYDSEASYDLNDDDADPMPAWNDNNKHGTRCAGEVAMEANNGVCGVGVAFASKIGGIRMLDGDIMDRLEAEALSFNNQHVQVYSASWGPNDDGMTVEGPGRLATHALENGAKQGRSGLGSVFVWASGNGGHYQDDCNCDGYTDSIYTFSVSSAAQSGRFPWYGEKCASTLTATYSSGAYTDQQIATVDVEIEAPCTEEHTGTSASAPLAAGIVALALHANPRLTWRDLQHIAVWTGEPAPLMHNDGWHKNGRGLWANIRFGFGLMNAEAFVNASQHWQTVPENTACTTTFPDFNKTAITMNDATIVRLHTNVCGGQVKYLEAIQIVTDISYSRRGNLAIWLVSPIGTRTKLLSPRRRDDSVEGFEQWPFMSVHTWGEDPAGYWQLEIYDRIAFQHAHSSEHNQGSLNNVTLIMHGTNQMPAHYAQQRQYNMDYNDTGDKKKRTERLAELINEAHAAADDVKQRYKRNVNRRLSDHELDSHLMHTDRALDVFETLHEHQRLHL